MELFDRTCRVTIGPEAGEGPSISDDFRIWFKVVRSIGEELNTAEVEISNLSEYTRRNIQRDNQVCLIEAGYRGGIEVLAIADVTRSIIRHSPPDIITSIECSDGAKALRDRRVNLSFEAGASVQRVLDRIAQELALGTRATGTRADGEYLSGVSFSGTAKDALNQVTRKAGLIWSIQNGELQISDRVDANQSRAVKLTPETGLLDSPEPLDDPEEETEKRRGRGYRVRTLLNPKIVPGDEIIIESREVDGVYRVDVVEHTGDTRGQEWVTEAEVYAE